LGEDPRGDNLGHGRPRRINLEHDRDAIDRVALRILYAHEEFCAPLAVWPV
jgi:hypothetical protein